MQHPLASPSSVAPPQNVPDRAPQFQYFVDEDERDISPPQTFTAVSSNGGQPVAEVDMETPRRHTHRALINPLMASKSNLLFGDHGYFRKFSETKPSEPANFVIRVFGP